jgi:hypothetical protein
MLSRMSSVVARGSGEVRLSVHLITWVLVKLVDSESADAWPSACVTSHLGLEHTPACCSVAVEVDWPRLF